MGVMRECITCILCLVCLTACSQNKHQQKILDLYIEANNTGTDEAFHRFIKETYEPALYEKINLADHIDFYQHVRADFGELKSILYKKIEESTYQFVVHLIRKNDNILNPTIDPAHVLVLEMDLSKTNPAYIRRGLGLGALVCEKEKR